MIYGDLLRKCHELEKEVDELSFENQNLKAENQGLLTTFLIYQKKFTVLET